MSFWDTAMTALFVTSNRLWGKVTTYQRPGFTAFSITGQPMFVDRLQDPQTGPFDSIFYRVADFSLVATFGASVVAKFTGPPNSAGTIRFDAITYISQQVIDNSIPYQFFRGGNAQAAAENLSAAINALSGYAGSAYSTATTAHPTCRATYVDNGDNTASVMVSYKTVGEVGNFITAEDHMSAVSLEFQDSFRVDFLLRTTSSH
jgi:hypothetical protein